MVSGLRGLDGLGGIAVLIGHGGFFHGVRVVTHDVLAVGILSIHECDRQSLNHLAPGAAPGRGIGGVQRHRPWILLRHGCAIRAEALNRLRRHRIATAIGIVRGDLQFDRLRPFEVAVLPYLLDGQVNGSATVLAARVLTVVRFGGESAVVVGYGHVKHEHCLGWGLVGIELCAAATSHSHGVLDADPCGTSVAGCTTVHSAAVVCVDHVEQLHFPAIESGVQRIVCRVLPREDLVAVLCGGAGLTGVRGRLAVDAVGVVCLAAVAVIDRSEDVAHGVEVPYGLEFGVRERVDQSAGTADRVGVDHVVVCQHALVVQSGEAARVACGKILHTVGILSCPSAEHVIATGDARYGGLFHASTVALDELDGQVAARPIHINAVFAARQFDDTIADGDNRHVGLLLVLIISLGQSNTHLQSEQVHVQHVAFRKHLEIEYLAEDGREPLA